MNNQNDIGTNSSDPKDKISVGIVFSTSGPYAGIARELQNGALLAVAEVNADPQFDFQLDPVIVDPGGDLAAYQSICRELLKQGGLKHVIGCYTSSSRKEVTPVFEKYDGLLWYPSHYEGFEHCNNIIYTGASPNQHIVPLMAHMLEHFGNRAYCIGSDYIWGWESNRIMRECVTEHGARDFWERYMPVGSVDVGRFIDEIIRYKPSYVFNSLIGISSESFMRAMQEARLAHPELSCDIMPVCSHTLSEPELTRLAPDAAAGHIASSVYFQSTPGEQNARFIRGYKRRYGAQGVTSADSEAAYNTCHLLARALQKAGTQELDAVKSALYEIEFDAPQGRVWIDRGNNHCYLTPALAVSNPSGQFEIFHTYDAPLRPDPYLVDVDFDTFAARRPADERVAL
ncbi:transporter substrate-binding domain-containing protein [Microbulbifer sp. S227A]|uniref:transporter substrate-binding domain-containing protein n=1 Tax=Microbulbifer sp. S227A TaxID=3415131 RepID=UPI003C7BAD92